MSASAEAARGQPRRFAGLGLRAKLFLTIVAVVGIATALSELVAEDALEGLLLRRIEAELHATAAGAAVALLQVPGAAGAPNAVALDGLADALGEATGVRVTLIDAAGRVRGDSEVTLAGLGEVEVHNARAEVVAARAHGQGTARRRSATLATDMLYVAVRAPVGDTVYVTRAATPLVEVAQSVRALRVALAVAGAAALFVALALGALASQMMSGRLRALVQRTQRVRGVEVGPVEDDDEIGKLAVTVGTLESALDAQVSMLERERDRFEAVLRAMGEGVVALDREGRVLFFNPAARQLLALDDAAVGQSLAALFPTLVPLVQRADVAEADPVRSVELEMHAAARTLLRVSRQEAAFGAVVVVHDVTDIRRLERLRRDFVANVSHELRTPVSIILANGEMLLSGALDDKERSVKFVEAVHRNAERLKDLINDLLDIARMEAGEQTFARVPVDLHAVATHVVELLAPRADDKRQAVSVHVDLDLRVAGDAKAIDQVLTNLVENAIKYTPDDGHIVVRAARAAASTVRINVEDDGPGVEEKHRARLFERFYRVDKGRSRDQGGTGLGLAIVKHLVEGMGGSVGVEAREPRGMVFWFELPGA